MRCSRCGHDNPENNFFCGNCGSPLLRRTEAQSPPARPIETAARGRANEPIAGPSFLGLAQESSSPSSEKDTDLGYLYEDPPQNHYARLIVAVLALAGFGAFIAYQWRQFPNWRTALSSLQSKPTSAKSRQIWSTPAQQQAEPAKAHQDAAAQQPSSSDSSLAAAQNPPPATQPSSSNSTEVHSTSTHRDQMPQSDAAPPAKGDAPRVTPSRNDTDVLLTRGLAYLYGSGARRSCEQALVFLNSAARRGNTKANSQLGGLYATGHCVPLDRARAYRYFTRAREAGGGNVYVERNRSMLWNQMSDEEKARVRGAE